MSFIDKFMGKNDANEEEVDDGFAWNKSQNVSRDYERPQSKETRPFEKNIIDFNDVISARDSLASASTIKFVVIEPKAFDDSQEIANCLSDRRPVVINIENTDPEVAKRIIDFASGTAYALNGEIKKVSRSVFLLVPNNVNVSLPEEKRTSMDWLKK